MPGWGVCHAETKEAGPWFEIESVKNVIIGKEKRGANASYERSLLKSWANYEGYEGAKEALKLCGKPLSHS